MIWSHTVLLKCDGARMRKFVITCSVEIFSTAFAKFVEVIELLCYETFSHVRVMNREFCE